MEKHGTDPEKQGSHPEQKHGSDPEEHGADLDSERFEIKERLGSGGMGVVYRAHDRKRGIDVALKALLRVDGQTIYRFKREFRSLTDLVHPNLVTLYELLSVGEEWFFTMELVDGVTFLEHVRPERHLVGAGTVTPALAEEDHDEEVVTLPTRPMRSDPCLLLPRELRSDLDVDRLRPALRQLAGAVRALHAKGKLHRDIKPSNVLVSTRGRVVLCDFGLVVESEEDKRTREARAVGTPAYMSPEQAANKAVAEPSDWYSVGVMLYEALTGLRPHYGAGEELTRLKNEVEPANPREVCADVPADLADLCMRLLRRAPAERPSASEILEIVGAAPVRGLSSPEIALPVRRVAFVGREQELAVLRAALADTRRGTSVSMFVHGFSGMGKTSLVRQFLDEVKDFAVVLGGRCYECESVPYKALDTLVDALSSYLLRRPHKEIEALIPRDVVQLARLFPVLRRVKAVAAPKVRSFEPPDPQESRRRGFAALRELLKRLAETRAVVLFIDDLQWGDVDSAAFLADLCTHPERPPLLLISCHRSEDVKTSPLLRALLALRVSGHGDIRELRVDPLSNEDARAVAEGIFRDAGGRAHERLDEVIEESGRNPFFLAELAYASARTDEAPVVSLEQFLQRRVEELPDDARALLTVSAVAGRPLPVVVAGKAAGLEVERAAVAVLCSERLARTHQAAGGQEIEPYHDRVREPLLASLDEEQLRATHRRLAGALEQTERPDLQALVEHWLAAGDTNKAGGYASRAAEEAERALAFDRAAHYLELELELRDLPADERHARQVRMADALANAGRLLDAADVYLDAATGADDPVAELELRRRAVENLLHGGRLEDGLEQTVVVLDAVGLRLPRSSRHALRALLWRRLLIRLRGLGFRERPEAEVPPAVIKRLDVCHATSSGLSFVDPLLGKVYQMQHMLDALKAGEPVRVSLALSLELGYLGLAGVKTRERIDRVFSRALELAEREESPEAIGLAHAAYGVAAFLTGRWRSCVEHSQKGMKVYRDQCIGVRWEIAITQVFYTAGLLYMGAIKELATATPLLVREAIERGDQHAGNGLRAWRSNVAWLAMDEPDEARAQADKGAAPTTKDDFHLHHYYAFLTHAQIDLYEGEVEQAWDRLTARWRDLQKSMLLRIQSVRVESALLQARCALARAAAGSERDAMLRVAEKAARRIEKERIGWGNATAALVRGLIAQHRGEEDRAAPWLGEAVEGFEVADMALFAAVARRRYGEILGGDEGEAEVRAANEWMAEQEIAAPDRMTAMYAPIANS